ncbi:MAG: hypothetical protein CM15mP65_30500 [Crocinitomicaceae bacterium]|nr:MAG: hypothetical protein CM15mP65_30500 [Crocinitomicaceae bacterium]
MAVGNYRVNFPKDASVSFGEMFIELFGNHYWGKNPRGIIYRASETKGRTKTPIFSYLQDYLKGKGLNIF